MIKKLVAVGAKSKLCNGWLKSKQSVGKGDRYSIKKLKIQVIHQVTNIFCGYPVEGEKTKVR